MGLDAIELVLTTEKHFGVIVPGEMVEPALTVESLANVLFDLRFQTKTPLPYEKILEEVRQLVAVLETRSMTGGNPAAARLSYIRHMMN